MQFSSIFTVTFVFLCMLPTGGFAADVSQETDQTEINLPACPIQLGTRANPTAYSTVPFNCYCSADARRKNGGYAFGGGPYDGISNICMAAVHAGATGREGGNVRVIPGPVLDSYIGTLANGVFSADWDYPSQFGSFEVEAFTPEE